MINKFVKGTIVGLVAVSTSALAAQPSTDHKMLGWLMYGFYYGCYSSEMTLMADRMDVSSYAATNTKCLALMTTTPGWHKLSISGQQLVRKLAAQTHTDIVDAIKGLN